MGNSSTAMTTRWIMQRNASKYFCHNLKNLTLHFYYQGRILCLWPQWQHSPEYCRETLGSEILPLWQLRHCHDYTFCRSNIRGVDWVSSNYYIITYRNTFYSNLHLEFCKTPCHQHTRTRVLSLGSEQRWPYTISSTLSCFLSSLSTFSWLLSSWHLMSLERPSWQTILTRIR